MNRGTGGYFWSAGASSSTKSRYLYFRGTNVYPENDYYKTSGFPVRCLEVSQHTLYNVRDQESYTVRKLADGNVWMTENLRLEFDGTSATGLTAGDSNIASTYTSSNPLVIGATQSRNGIVTDAEVAEYVGSEMTD